MEVHGLLFFWNGSISKQPSNPINHKSCKISPIHPLRKHPLLMRKHRRRCWGLFACHNKGACTRGGGGNDLPADQISCHDSTMQWVSGPCVSLQRPALPLRGKVVGRCKRVAGRLTPLQTAVASLASSAFGVIPVPPVGQTLRSAYDALLHSDAEPRPPLRVVSFWNDGRCRIFFAIVAIEILLFRDFILIYIFFARCFFLESCFCTLPD